MILEKISKEILNWSGVIIDQHRFGGTEFRIGKREMGHIHGNRLADLPFLMQIRNQYVLFFEPKSETSKSAALLSFGRMAKRTEDLDTFVAVECYSNQRKAIEDFREDEYDTLGKLKASKIPVLVIMGDHDICFHVEDWYPLVGKLPSIQLIVMPLAGHGVEHQYPDLAAKYITSFIGSSFS